MLHPIDLNISLWSVAACVPITNGNGPVVCTNDSDSREALKGGVTCNKGFYFVSGPLSDTCEGVQQHG
jgi:hypothetical protein